MNAFVRYVGPSGHDYAPRLWEGVCKCGFVSLPELSPAEAWAVLDAHRGYKRSRRGATEGSTTNTAP